MEHRTQRKIFKLSIDGTDQDLWRKLVRLRDETAEEDCLAIHRINSMNVQRFRKLLEWTFHKSKTKVLIYTAKQTGTDTDTEKKTQRERKTYALIVNDPEKEYHTMLKDIKQVIGENPARLAIKGIRSTREGKLLIVTEKDDKAITEIENAISSALESAKIVIPGRTYKTETIHIRGLDAITKKEEVIVAIESEIGPLTGKYNVSETRPNRGNTQAVTVTLEKGNAETLIKRGQIRIGMVRCAVERRLEIKKCRKCLAFGHQAKACNGPDRSNTCFRCGKDGHAAKACTAAESCPICEEPGHKLGSGKCKAFRAALAEARRAKRREIPESAFEDRAQDLGEGLMEVPKTPND